MLDETLARGKGVAQERREIMQRYTQENSVRFDTYAEAAEYKATLEGRVKIRRRYRGFDVLTYKAIKVKDDHLEEGE